MKKLDGVVLGTFLPFHKGHEMLINFAASYVEANHDGKKSGKLVVIISSRSFETISGADRADAIRKTFSNRNVFVYEHTDDNAPQNPSSDNDVEFWDYWKRIIDKAVIACGVNVYGIKHVFSSESYGEKVASIIGAEHVMFDNKRLSANISGTAIRNDPVKNSHMINDHMMKHIRKKFVVYGAESVGKSTMTKIMGDIFPNSITATEYARPYLESQVDKTPSFYNMDKIFHGQAALEKAVTNAMGGDIMAFMDTDIMSTFGYAKMVGMDSTPYEDYLPKDDRVYLLLTQDEVPFEKDILRYGDNVRESDDQYWIDILKQYGIDNYHIIKGALDERITRITDIVTNELHNMVFFQR